MMFNKIYNGIEKLFLWFGYITLTVMMVATFVDAMMRYLFNSPLTGMYNLTQEYFMPMFVFLCLAYVFSRGSFIRVTVFSKGLPEKVNRFIMMIFDFLAFGLYLFISYGLLQKALKAIQIGEFSSSRLAYPMAPIYIIASAGAFLLSIRLLMAIFHRHPEGHEEG